MNDADPDPERVELLTDTYEAAGGREQFVSFEDPEADLLVGFCRLRYPSHSPFGDRPDADPVRTELRDAAIVRELHVYGNEVGLGGEGDWQHRGYGKRLVREAERRASADGFSKLAIISGIGVRQYYREKLGYRQDGPYVSKRL
jgi:elongator complex protein 3